jgi:hypothetical protein
MIDRNKKSGEVAPVAEASEPTTAPAAKAAAKAAATPSAPLAKKPRKPRAPRAAPPAEPTKRKGGKHKPLPIKPVEERLVNGFLTVAETAQFCRCCESCINVALREGRLIRRKQGWNTRIWGPDVVRYAMNTKRDTTREEERP